MSRVITFSRAYPAYHPEAGQSTFFVEKIHYNIWSTIPDKWMDAQSMIYDLNRHLPRDIVYDFIESLQMEIDFSDSEKCHTIRAGHQWKPGDWFSPRVWSCKPYNSKQIIIAPDIQVKKTFDFELHGGKAFFKRSGLLCEIVDEDLEQIAKNDGLLMNDFVSWFHNFSKEQECQIICWDETINY